MNPETRLQNQNPFEGKTDEEIRTLARTLALGYLNHRETSVLGLRTYLVSKRKIPAHIVEPLLADLQERGWLDNLRYARLLVRNLVSQLKGPQAILMKLKQKGIHLTSEQLREITEEVSPQHEELEAAKKWALRRYPQAQTDPDQKRRAFQALVRRGFSMRIASQALQTTTESEEVN